MFTSRILMDQAVAIFCHRCLSNLYKTDTQGTLRELKAEGENLFGCSCTQSTTFSPSIERYVDYMLRQYRLEMLAIFVEPLSVIMLLLMLLTEYGLSPVLEESFKNRGGASRFSTHPKRDNDV